MSESTSERCPLCGAEGDRRLCDGSGSVVRREPLLEGHPVLYTFHVICPHKAALQVIQNMDPAVRNVPHYTGPTPLLEEDNPFLAIQRNWWTVARNVQSFVVHQPDPFGFRLKVTSDREIVEVRLGLGSDDSDPDASESERRIGIGAFVGPYDLVVVRLGELGHRNAAAPGYLYEAVTSRVHVGKRTWLTWPKRYGVGDFSWSAGLDHLINTAFKRNPKLKVDSKDRGVLTA